MCKLCFKTSVQYVYNCILTNIMCSCDDKDISYFILDYTSLPYTDEYVK